VYNRSSSSPSMNDVTATADDGSNNYGVRNDESSPSMNNVTATATRGNNNYGVYNDESSPSIRNSSITADNSIYNENASGQLVEVANTELNGEVEGFLKCVGVYNTAFVVLDLKDVCQPPG
jgi:hypothetical protein